MANDVVQSLDPNANLITLNAIIGVVMPGLIEVVNRESWTAQMRALVSLASCVAVGFVTTWFAGDLSNAGDVSSAMLAVFGSAVIAYNQWWKTSGLAQSIRSAVNPGTAPVPPQKVVVTGEDLSIDQEETTAADGS
jgi:hypothetical protein